MTQKYTAIVTGASSGIGRAISEKLGVLGYEVFGIGRRFDTEEDRDIALSLIHISEPTRH